MSCTIPFGPTDEPLGLNAGILEFVSLEGPQTNIENEHMTLDCKGRFIRFAGTRAIKTFTANYVVLTNTGLTAALPKVGRHQVSAGPPAVYVWVRSVNKSEPQENDQTVSITYVVPEDIVNCEALREDFDLAELHPDSSVGSESSESVP